MDNVMDVEMMGGLDVAWGRALDSLVGVVTRLWADRWRSVGVESMG